MAKGWIKLHRQIMDHPFYTEERVFSRHEAWEYLLLNANHADARIMIDGQMITVERGSFITSNRKLQDRWNWSNTKVSRFLDVLQSEGMITLKSDTKKTVITIDKYGFYQGGDDEETTPKRRVNDAEATQKHTNNNVKNKENDKKLKMYTPEFEEFWNAYPRKVGKKEAFDVWLRATKKTNAEIIIRCAENYAAACRRNETEERYIAHPKTFLHPDKERFMDYQSDPAQVADNSKQEDKHSEISEEEANRIMRELGML